jgi:hypothetical protein
MVLVQGIGLELVGWSPETGGCDWGFVSTRNPGPLARCVVESWQKGVAISHMATKKVVLRPLPLSPGQCSVHRQRVQGPTFHRRSIIGIVIEIVTENANTKAGQTRQSQRRSSLISLSRSPDGAFGVNLGRCVVELPPVLAFIEFHSLGTLGRLMTCRFA